MVRWFLAFLLLWAGACAKKAELDGGYGGGAYGTGGGGSPGYAMEESISADSSAGRPMRKESTGRAYNSAPASMAPAPPPPPPMVADDFAPEPEPEPTAEPESPARMVHYDGYAQIRVTKPEDTLIEAEAIAAEYGGRVDRLSGNTISIRVPVARFDEAWKAALALGDVLDQTVRADDITEQFLAVDLRVKTLSTTRDRLIVLLAKATEEQEKLQLLAQITRVNEELDGYESQRRALADLAAFSRISLALVARQAFTGTQRPELDGMRWLSQLSPFRRAVFADDKRIALPEPDGMVSLSNKGPFSAESPDGTVLWTLRMPNDPEGSGDFWVGALRDRLAESFTGVEEQRLGSWSCLVLDEPGADAPYRWQVCIKPNGKHLEVGQVFYPSPAQVDRYGAGIEGSFKAGGGA